MSAPPLVVAVVLNWNNYDDTSACLESIQSLDYDNLDVVVVDNGSTDGSGKRLDSSFETIPVLYNESNEGFAGGMNTGIEYALRNGAEYVWVTNNDTIYPDSTALDTLVEYMQTHESVGGVTPKIIEYREEGEQNQQYTDNIWFEHGRLDNRSYNAHHNDSEQSLLDLRFNRAETSQSDTCITNEYIPLCSALIRREIFEEVGLLTEEYFLYYEDVEFCWRVTKSGSDLVTHRGATIGHRGGGSTAGKETKKYYIERNRVLFAQTYSLVTVWFILISLWRITILVGYHLANKNGDVVRAIVRGVFDGVKKETGRGPYP